jgi:hypothetical protein
MAEVIGWRGGWAAGPFSVQFKHRNHRVRIGFDGYRMTAIVSLYVQNQGFVLGSDTLSLYQNGTETTDNRKIFSIEKPNATLAYAWAGNTCLYFDGGQEFDFIQHSKAIADTFVTNGLFTDYVALFIEEISRRLREFAPDGRLSNNPNVFRSDQLADILLVGYFDGEPYRAKFRIRHKNSVLIKPRCEEICKYPPSDFDIFSGCEGPRKRFAEAGGFNDEPESLSVADSLIRSYIQDCIDHRHQESDCAHIGGRIQMATVTDGAFTWEMDT